MAIPTSFTSNAVLASGTYDATFDQIRKSVLITGTGSSPFWDAVWRNQLLDNAEILTKELWAVGIKNVYLDGSFVEDKDCPNDIDGYFETGLTLTRPDLHKFATVVQSLNLKNKHKIWNWNPNSRISVAGFAKRQLPVWVYYRVELYPYMQQTTGIKDAQGNDLTFPSAFRQCRASGIPKGIIKVIQGGKR